MNFPPISPEDINPIIGNIPADTFTNVSNILALSEDLIAQSDCQELSKAGTSGLFVIIGCVREALDYEIENRSKNLVRAEVQR